MPPLPATCDHCGLVFAARGGIVIENARDILMTDNTVTCPRCGGMGRYVDGRYDVIGDTIRIVATSAMSAESLGRLQRLLEEARRTRADPATVARRIEEEAPEFRELASKVSARTPENILIWLTFMLLIIQTLVGNVRDFVEPRQAITPEVIEQIYQRALENSQATPPQATPKAQPTRSAQIGRNEPCHCGSGKKFKKCHGR